MRRGWRQISGDTEGWGLLALAALLLGLLIIPANAWALEPQTITFTSSPPSPAIAGESYEVSARSSSGAPVELLRPSSVGGPCSFEKPEETMLLEGGGGGPYPLRQEARMAPQTLYLDGVGTCDIGAVIAAGAEGEAHPVRMPEAVQEFSVAKNPGEQITFVSTPSNAVTGGTGTYPVFVRASPALWLEGFVSTPSVCEFPFAQSVKTLAAGTCTIEVRQWGVSTAEPPEAQQSFTVGSGSRVIYGHHRKKGPWKDASMQ